MTGDPDVLSFIREHIRSVWALELLLKLKADPERCWSADANLAALVAAGLSVPDDAGCFRYRPAAPALARLCDELEETYRVRPVTVIRWISAPAERLKSLADAFRFKPQGPSKGEGK